MDASILSRFLTNLPVENNAAILNKWNCKPSKVIQTGDMGNSTSTMKSRIHFKLSYQNPKGSKHHASATIIILFKIKPNKDMVVIKQAKIKGTRETNLQEIIS
ncbi:hypothetical protein ACH5RR_021452 [Cinchona calisaya]|uniref:Uncharacterized protein n=1 Tax=Cinchona calisaya TaxID=153742 RepID=A0ABD2ZHJ8_9GENT